MKSKIGFTYFTGDKKQEKDGFLPAAVPAQPRKSVVEVQFPGISRAYSYYNDQFDLKEGDWVYVEGKLEGERGRVTKVNYGFKIKLSDYKRVIAVVDTSVKGELFLAGSHLVAFDRSVIPAEKISLWFKAPVEEEEGFVCGESDESFPLSDLMEIAPNRAVAERGVQYYMDCKVRYLCLDGTKGYAVVKGAQYYEVEFTYSDGLVRQLTCPCYCSSGCKHEIAALLQLRETLQKVEKHYADLYERTGYFAAIVKSEFFSAAMESKECGSFTFA